MSAPAPAPAPAEPRPRRGLVAAAVLLVALVAGTGAAQLFSQVVSSTLERTTTLSAATDRFTVDSDAGDVAIAPSTDGDVHVHTVVRHGLGTPELVEESTASGVRLDVDCNALLASRCDVDYTVELPPSFEVVVGGTAGDVTTRDITGPIRIDRAAGDIALFDVRGPIDVTSSTGEITGYGVRSETVRAESRSGDVRLVLLDAPRSVQVDTRSGEVDVAVPAGTDYRVSASTRSGERSVTVPVNPAADRTIRVDSDAGDVRIHTSPLPVPPPAQPAPPPALPAPPPAPVPPPAPPDTDGRGR